MMPMLREVVHLDLLAKVSTALRDRQSNEL
jgi:hypothetical protein